MTHSIPDSSAVALGTELGTVLITGDYKFDQTPVDGPPADVSRLAELGREGVLLLCGDSTNVDRPGFSTSESVVGPHLRGGVRPLRGPDRGDELRVEHPPRPAGRGRRRGAGSQGGARRALDAQERRHRHGRSVTSRSPMACSWARGRSRTSRMSAMVIISTGSQGEPLSALRRMAYRDHRQVQLRRGDTVVFSATPIPGNERAVNETIDRLYHIGCDVVTPRDAPVHASGHGYAEEIKLMLNLVKPRYVMPFHGDFKRLRLHAQLAEAVGVPPEDIFQGDNGLPLDIDERRARFGKPEQSGMIFVDGVEIGDMADVALRDRRMLSADGIFIVVVTIAEQDGRSVADPEVIFRGVPFLDQADELLRGDPRDRRRHAATGGQGGNPRGGPPRSSCCTTIWRS